MATKRQEEVISGVLSTGEGSTLKFLSFVTPEDYMDLAVNSQIYSMKSKTKYATDIFPRQVRDTFLRLNLNSGLAEVQDVP